MPITNQKKRKRQQSTDFPTNKKHKSATTLDSNEPQKSSPTRHSDKAVQDRDTPGNGKHEKPRRYTAWTPYETEVVIYFFKSNIDLRKLPGLFTQFVWLLVLIHWIWIVNFGLKLSAIEWLIHCSVFSTAKAT